MKDDNAEHGSDGTGPRSALVLYQTEDGTTRIECRFEDESIWLTQAQIAALYQVRVPTVNQHLKSIYDDGELPSDATIRSYLIVRSEGSRDSMNARCSATPVRCGARMRTRRRSVSSSTSRCDGGRRQRLLETWMR